MKCLVIGKGSAGNRHTQVLHAMGHEVRQVSAREPILLNGEEYAVIASRTPEHISHLYGLRDGLHKSGFTGKCLVEKPLFMKEEEDLPKPSFPAYVGYQLRFHPVIQALRKTLEGATVYSAHVYAGQHISLWGGSYHGDLSQGGGVLRDYSHELDLLLWLFGDAHWWRCTRTAHQDVACMAMEIGEVSVSAQFNYLDKTPAREWIVVTDKGTFRADLTAHFAADTTRLMHEAILSGSPDACTYEEGLAVNRLIDGLEA